MLVESSTHSMATRSTINLLELFQLFPDQESARLYLEDRRWGGKPGLPSLWLLPQDRHQGRQAVRLLPLSLLWARVHGADQDHL